jgi:hypothetical protein
MIDTATTMPSAGIENIPHASDDSIDNNLVVVLPSGYTAPKQFFDRILRQAITAIPTLTRSRALKATELLGQEFWASLGNADRRLAGRCIAHMVATDHLPLAPIEGKPTDPLWYRRK